jgi:hypothetical protein
MRISCQSVLIHRKISGTVYAKSREKYMEFEGKTPGFFYSGINLVLQYKKSIVNRSANVSAAIPAGPGQ